MDKTYCIFGDSITQAAYVETGWVHLLRRHLEGKYKNDFVNIFNLGVGGNTTDDVLKRLVPEAKARNPTAIIFAVGINDTKAGDDATFKDNLEEIIGQAKCFTQDITFVGLVIGEYLDDEPFTKAKTQRFNQVVSKTAQAKGCKFIEMTGLLDAFDFLDGLHPNDQGHQKMFEIIKRYF